MHVLCVDDEHPVLETLGGQLSEAGFDVDFRSDGPGGLEAARKGGYDMVVMDVGLPGMSGFEAVEALRASGDTTPVIMLTALGSEDDIVKGLDVGADGYLTKPYTPGELVARIRAIKRRETLAADPSLSFSDLVLDQAEQKVMRGGIPLRLTGTEFKLLALLMKAQGGILSKADLLQRIWGIDFDPQTPMVEVHIANLRKKLKAAGPPLIETVRGEGYRMAEGDKTSR